MSYTTVIYCEGESNENPKSAIKIQNTARFSGVSRNFFSGGGVSINSVEDRGQRERGYGGVAPLVRGSGGSCNFVQEISFRIVKFS